MNAVHLGDGAYVSEWDDGIQFTASHHDPSEASDTVRIARADVPALLAFFRDPRPETCPKCVDPTTPDYEVIWDGSTKNMVYIDDFSIPQLVDWLDAWTKEHA